MATTIQLAHALSAAYAAALGLTAREYVLGEQITVDDAVARALDGAGMVQRTPTVPGLVDDPYAFLPDRVAALTAKDLFFVAHRGCGDEHPEHTLAGYTAARAKGYEAVEVSVHRTADGAIVCHHDATLDRTTSLTGNLAARTLGELQGNIVDYGATYLGPGWPNQPLPLLSDVLDALMGRVVIFLEPKNASGPVAEQILDIVETYPNARRSVVWKYFRSADATLPPHAVNARSRGLRLWTYMDDVDADSLIDDVGEVTDYIGMPVGATDAKISRAVATGKPVIVWEVRNRRTVARLQALDVAGMMCTTIAYCGSSTAMRTAANFTTGVRAPGDQPANESKPPTYDAANGIIQMAQGTDATVLLGSMSPIANAAASYRIDFDLRWPTLPSDLTTHSDLFWGHADDTPYIHQGTANVDGFHAVLRANGQIQLYTHSAGSGTGTQLATTNAVAAPVANTWMSFRVTVTPTTVTLQRMDDGSAVVSATNATRRGGYWGLANGNINNNAQFRNVVVTNL